MIARQQLLADLKPLLKLIEADLRARCDDAPEIGALLQAEYDEARAANRTGVTFEEWRADLITQVAVAWVLSCVFVRFLEDNALIAPPRISGPLHGAGTDAGLQRARDEREAYFRLHPKQTDRDYLLFVFDALAKLPGTKDVFGPHNPALAPSYRNWLSGDAAQKLIEFFQKIDADGTGELIHDFTDPVTATGGWDTRFLGDLYQDLSEAARKKYALLQTPIFVEEFIIDRTLEPAIAEFGLDAPGGFKMIDPACGSGHFLLGSFARILKHRRAREPGASDRELVNRTLASVHGVDLNPYAIAIARFRLLLVAMRECHITRLADAPAFAFNLVCGDSLLHGPRFADTGVGAAGAQVDFHFGEMAHHYALEDADVLNRILAPGTYHAVVANPPYITVKDKALNQAYRDRYPEVCHMKYSLSVPFIQRLNDLTVPNGFTGQITANSFMKREFGKKLIESYLPKWDLTHVIDTSGAYIPGHGTPTVILFGRNRRPVATTLRTVMGIVGEPAAPEDPARGLVWTAVVDQLDRPGSQSRYVSVNDSPRETFHRHPWSIGGGGASELKEVLDDNAVARLSEFSEAVGITAVTGEDDLYLQPAEMFRRSKIESTIRLVVGDVVRDWNIYGGEFAFWLYDEKFELIPIAQMPAIAEAMWPFKASISQRKRFGTRMLDRGLTWYEWQELYSDKLVSHLSVVFGFVATDNHFVLDRGGKVFKQSAPVIKLPVVATEDDYFAFLGLLNSSTACFWLKQVCNCKGLGGQGGGIKPEHWFRAFEFDSTKLETYPLPSVRPPELARSIDTLAQSYAESLPEAVCRRAVPDAATLARAREQAHHLRGQMIALQEELDWQCYRLYGLLSDDSAEFSRSSGEVSRTSEEVSRASGELSRASGELSGTSGELSRTSGKVSQASGEGGGSGGGTSDNAGPPPIALGERAFEIVLARQMAAGEVETTWFTRHGSTPITEIPQHWPADYRAVVQRRIDLIESDKNIGLIEKPEYKRRWNTEPWDEQQAWALKGWLLDRLESYFDLDGRMNDQKEITARGELHDPRVTSVAKVADIARADKDFMQVAEIYAGRMDFDVGKLVGELITAEAVPALPVLRYKPGGMDKRVAWERTWDLQREEDRINTEIEKLTEQWKELEKAGKPTSELQSKIGNLKSAIPKIPVPPKYTSADFQNSNYWRLRGKLDVPKERWVSFPHCEGEDGTLPIAWAGYDHLQLARAIAERYELAKETEGRTLTPLLAAIGQLIPWLKQWHNDLDPAFGTRMGDYFENYLAEAAKTLGMSVEDVMAWTPPVKAKRGKKTVSK